MSVEDSKLVVIPKGKGIEEFISEDKALQIAAQVLDAQPPEGFWENAQHYADEVREWTAFGKLHKQLERNVFDRDLTPHERWKRVQAEHDLIVGLVRGLLDTQIESEGRLENVSVYRPEDEKLEFLDCPSGTFRPEVVYREHPVQGHYYVPLAEFHPQMLHDKKAEFLDIATALGAKEIRIAASESRSKSGEASAGADDPTGQTDGGVEVAARASETQDFGVEMRFERPNQPPQDPSEVYWLDREPMWQSMVSARMSQWVTEYRVNFSYTSDFGVNANVAASIQNIGLGIGGEYQSREERDTEYIVEFWPKSAYGS
jgi:hypothetical protein